MSKAFEDMLPGDLTREKLESLRVGEPYRSRKNRVFRIRLEGSFAVAKIYAPTRIRLAQLEHHVLSKSYKGGVLVPRPLAIGNGTIVMEHVEGENLSDMFDRLWRADGDSINGRELRRLVTDGVAGWLAQFHRIIGFHEARGDTILRNFIVSGDQICGLDFEEAGHRDPLSDLGEVCANLLSMDPMFTARKFEMVRELSESYWHHSGSDRSAELSGAVASALEHYSAFRADGESLRVWANNLRTDGLPK
jgi:tRNA A-37 threonylcarbamoyl transferase component Bud32